MEKQLKLQKRKKNPLPVVGFQVPEKYGVLSILDVSIVFVGQGEYVCGSCYLLLRTLGLRYSLRSPFRVPPPTFSFHPVDFLISKDGCKIGFLAPNPSLFPNLVHETEFTIMGFYLECHRIGEIIKRVNVPYQSAENEKNVFFKNYGDMVSLMSSKLTAHLDWAII